MARCCGDSCNCKINVIDDGAGNPLVQIVGTGSPTDPFEITVLALTVIDTAAIDLALVWVDDTIGYRLSAAFAASSALDMLGDVNAPSPTNGQVLGWDNATGKWTPRAPTTAPTGAVTHDTSLTGDGSGGSPLGVAFDPAGGLEDAGVGAALTDGMKNALVAHYTDATARAAATPAPVLGTLSTLDDNPGMVDYWDGADWLPLIRLSNVTGTALIETSGPYTNGSVQLVVKTLSASTDADGIFELMSSVELATFAGLLSVVVQPVVIGTDPAWAAVIDDDFTTSVQCYAYALDGSGAIGSSIVNLSAIFYVYN